MATQGFLESAKGEIEQEAPLTDRQHWCNRMKWSETRSIVFYFLWPHGLCSPWNSPDQNTGVGSLSLLQGIFPTQGSNPGLLHCRQNLYQLSHQGSPRLVKWVAYPFSSGSSWPRNWTGVSCIPGKFFTNWVIRKCNRMAPENQEQLKTSSGLTGTAALECVQGTVLPGQIVATAGGD